MNYFILKFNVAIAEKENTHVSCGIISSSNQLGLEKARIKIFELIARENPNMQITITFLSALKVSPEIYAREFPNLLYSERLK